MINFEVGGFKKGEETFVTYPRLNIIKNGTEPYGTVFHERSVNRSGCLLR